MSVEGQEEGEECNNISGNLRLITKERILPGKMEEMELQQKQQEQQYPVVMETTGGESAMANDTRERALQEQSEAMLPKPVSLACSAEDEKASTSVSNQSSSGHSVEMESSAEYCGGGSVTTSDAELEMSSEENQISPRSSNSSGAVSLGSTGNKVEEGEDDDVNEEGCCMQEEADESGWNELEVSVEGSADEEERENNEQAIVKEVHSATWTDDKHSSYLNSMEATFVRNLYGTKNSHPIDDDAEEDCADSHLMSNFDCCTSTPSEFFELLQGGCYQQRAFYRPHTLEPPIPSAPAVFASPWIQHFNVKVAMGSNGTCPLVSNTAAEHSLTKLCPVPEGTYEIDGNKHEQSGNREVVVDEETRGIEELKPIMVDGSMDVPVTGRHLRGWQNQQKSHGKSLATGSLRMGARSPGQKRPLELHLSDGDIFLAKKSKTQQLARKDLEMLEQYVAGQQDQSKHAQATICPQPEQPEQDSADLQFSEPKTLLQAKGDTNVVKTSPLLSLDKSIKVYEDQGDLQRHAAKTVLDQVVSFLKEVENPHMKGCKTVTAFDGTSHCTESTVSSCITSQTTIDGECLIVKVSGEELLGPEGLLNSAAAAKELPSREGESDAPFCAGKNLSDHDGGHDALEVCLDMKLNPKNITLLEKLKQGLQEEGDQSPEYQSMQGGDVGEAEECEAEYSLFKYSKARTWTWGLEGPRRRVHEPSQS